VSNATRTPQPLLVEPFCRFKQNQHAQQRR
jgi:hypothetical protein